MTVYLRLPARSLSAMDQAEEHELEFCEFCDEWIEPGWGCRCATIDMKIDDKRDWWNEEWSDGQ